MQNRKYNMPNLVTVTLKRGKTNKISYQIQKRFIRSDCNSKEDNHNFTACMCFLSSHTYTIYRDTGFLYIYYICGLNIISITVE